MLNEYNIGDNSYARTKIQEREFDIMLKKVFESLKTIIHNQL